MTGDFLPAAEAAFFPYVPEQDFTICVLLLTLFSGRVDPWPDSCTVSALLSFLGTKAELV